MKQSQDLSSNNDGKGVWVLPIWQERGEGGLNGKPLKEGGKQQWQEQVVLQERELRRWCARTTTTSIQGLHSMRGEAKSFNRTHPFCQVRLTLSRSLRSAILLVTSSWAKSSFSCSNRMLASCRRRFSRWNVERNQLCNCINLMEMTISQG